MKERVPWFPFYCADFVGSATVMAMSLEERGAYITLLAFDWQESGLPDDNKTLARLLQLTPGKFARLWKTLHSNFELRNGRWFNPRLAVEREKQRVIREKCVRGGKARAKEMWQDRHSQTDSQTIATPIALAIAGATNGLQPDHSITQSQSQSQSQKTKNLVAVATEPDVDRVLAHYKQRHPRRKIEGEKFRRIVRSALKLGYTADELIAAIDGNASDPWCQQTGKHELSYVLRDAERIDSARLRGGKPLQLVRTPAASAIDPRDVAW